LTSRDMARLGVMILHKGLFNGKRILADEVVAPSTQQETPESECPYGILLAFEQQPGAIAKTNF
jgi:CubicO group peptidase (beta-lactamase class C family)